MTFGWHLICYRDRDCPRHKAFYPIVLRKQKFTGVLGITPPSAPGTPAAFPCRRLTINTAKVSFCSRRENPVMSERWETVIECIDAFRYLKMISKGMIEHESQTPSIFLQQFDPLEGRKLSGFHFIEISLLMVTHPMSPQESILWSPILSHQGIKAISICKVPQKLTTNFQIIPISHFKERKATSINDWKIYEGEKEIPGRGWNMFGKESWSIDLIDPPYLFINPDPFKCS